jgi:hypothetical protein
MDIKKNKKIDIWDNNPQIKNIIEFFENMIL